MVEIFFQTLPFFSLIGLGFLAVKSGLLHEKATAFLSTYVFYFALSAMLFRFASQISITSLWQTDYVLSYLFACFSIYTFVWLMAHKREGNLGINAIEAQCAIIGNVGFMGIPLLISFFGLGATRYILLGLTLDLIVFSSLIFIQLSYAKNPKANLLTLMQSVISIFKNPMIISISLGLLWGSWGGDLPSFVDVTLLQLSNAATPSALFVIGMSLATPSFERLEKALWLLLMKTLAFPFACAFFALWVFKLEPMPAAILIASSALPTASNIFLIAQNFAIGIKRVSSTIFISTLMSILTISLWVYLIKTKVLL